MANHNLKNILTAKVKHYIALHDRSPAAYPLTHQAVADYEDETLGWAKCSRTTLTAHGLTDVITAAASERKQRRSAIGARTTRAPSRLERRTAAALEEVELWKRRYETVLRKLRLIEYHLRASPHVDLDAIYRSEMEPPNRAEPKKQVSGKRMRHLNRI